MNLHFFSQEIKSCATLLFYWPDINECDTAAPTHNCDEGTSHGCINLVGSYRCDCKDGYRFDVGQCQGADTFV